MAKDPKTLHLQLSNNPGAKIKLSFIKGKNTKPREDDKDFEQWVRNQLYGHFLDLESISKEIVESFLYTNTARELSVELEARFGYLPAIRGELFFENFSYGLRYALLGDDILFTDKKVACVYEHALSRRLEGGRHYLFMVKAMKPWNSFLSCWLGAPCRKACSEKDSTIRGSMERAFDYYSVAVVLLSTLKDELDCLTPTPQCSCGACETVSELNLADQLMQFIMELIDVYDSVRNQILMMDPLPSVSTAFSMILRVEKQREVIAGPSIARQNMAMQAYKKGSVQRDFQKRRSTTDKKAQLKEVCFEIHGYRDWYKNLIEQRKKDDGITTRVFSAAETEDSMQNAIDEQAISDIIRTKLQRNLRGKEPAISNQNSEDCDGYLDHKD
ncbi:UNVERIFIED_CONTAM: hypothetical protein Slati_4232200 [Sesamum latifolium]|uniref:Uncharacterized protein n=1 Tax=Sesamum latifolium TaxID=2727402 RepID=A0AAW2TBV2_9LAMI